MATVTHITCDICRRPFQADGSVRKVRLEFIGPIIRKRQPLGQPDAQGLYPEGQGPNVVEVSEVDHTKDLGVEEACEECRDILRETIRKVKQDQTQRYEHTR